jgi:uncharacterized cupredoxin-like copper-binding protein
MANPKFLHITLTFGTSACFFACQPSVQDVHITAQDFRFVPTEVRVEPSTPVRLKIVNEGREAHEFTSPLLSDPLIRLLSVPQSETFQKTRSLKVVPGQSIEITLQAPSGTYLFRCSIRGHAGMNGTLVISE